MVRESELRLNSVELNVDCAKKNERVEIGLGNLRKKKRECLGFIQTEV